jgi:hypothetical protein
MTTLLTLRRPEQAFRSLGVFFLSGGVLGATALVLPHWETLDVGLMLIPTFAGLLGGPLMLVLAGRLPGWMCHPLLVLGTCVVTFGIAFSGSPRHPPPTRCSSCGPWCSRRTSSVALRR